MARQPPDDLMVDPIFRLWWFFYSRWVDWRCRRVGHTREKGLPPLLDEPWLCGRCGEPIL